MFLQVLTIAAAIGCGVVAGVFFAFSAFVMPGLARATPPAGLRAMQAINTAAVRPPLMIVLFGTAAVALAAGVAAVVERLATGSTGALFWTIGGAAVYILSAIVLTASYHVPRNDALAAVSVDQRDASDRWITYVREWTRWNHVRAIGSVAASLSFIVAALNA